ncbi:MAG: glucosylceramidase [Clostridia bacterium]|nr:glucosylceramidase [Clostridia bacterium]
MKVYYSGMENGKAYARTAEIQKDTSRSNREMALVCAFPEMTYQTVQGFGGALTDASGYVYSQMDPETRKEVIETYFGPGGLGYTWGRTSIDSSDFGTEMYAADDDPADEELENMDFSRCDRYVFPLLRDAAAEAGQPVRLMLTPWSPPAYMKSNQSRVHGGKLLEKYADRWARYMVKTVEHFLEEGMDVRLLSVQNEPNASQTWDSCNMTGADERAFVRNHLDPALRQHGLQDRLCLLIWDHNKERALDRALETISDDTMKEMIGGVAFHWYTGDHFEVLQMIREVLPDKRLVFSEGCVEHSVYGEDKELLGAVKYAHEYIGDLNHGADTLIDWNILLDEQGGPNHVANYCDAPLMYDRKQKKLVRKTSLEYIGHFSRYLKPGSRRIGTSSYHRDLEVTAVRNPDGTLAVVVLNAGEEKRDFFLKVHEDYYPLSLEGSSILTAVITP